MSIRTTLVRAIGTTLTVVAASCSANERWTQVGELTGGTMEVHFVVVEAQHRSDAQTYWDAADAVCGSDICQVGFFADQSEVPSERLTAEFFRHYGWKGRHEIALFFQNTNSGIRKLTWDCDKYPKRYLNDCLSPPRPPEMLSAAQARGPLLGFQTVKFGMSLNTVISKLGGSRRVSVLDEDNSDNRVIVKTEVIFPDRTFDGYFNVIYGKFSTVLMKWERDIDALGCAAEAKKISAYLESQFGKEDRFSYYDATEKDFQYFWLFADGSTISMEHLGSYSPNCSIALSFSDAEESEGR